MNMMNTTYFYDSDLYGGTVDRIASSIVFSGDMNELDKFCKRWYNRIDSISDEKQRMDVFIHLLVDLSQVLRAKKNIQMKLVVSDNFFMDFLFFISIFSTKEINLVTEIDIQHEYVRWVKQGFPQKLVKVLNLNDLKTLGDMFGQEYEENDVIQGAILSHKYEATELSMLQSSYSSFVCKYAENRIPIFFKMLRSARDKVVVPSTGEKDEFYELYNKIAKDENEKEFIFSVNPEFPNLFKVIEFLIRNINEMMFVFVSKDIKVLEKYCKQSLVLIWGLWLGTALEISMVPHYWYVKYRSLLDDMFGEGSFDNITPLG